MREGYKEFSKTIRVDKSGTVTYDTDDVTKALENEKAVELAQLVKGTDNEKLLAYRDPMVKKLVNFVMAAVIFESLSNDSLEPSFPLKVYRRYKSKDSLSGKMAKKGVATDYLGFRFVPTTEHEIYFADR